MLVSLRWDLIELFWDPIRNIEDIAFGAYGKSGIPFLTIKENGKCHNLHTYIIFHLSLADENLHLQATSKRAHVMIFLRLGKFLGSPIQCGGPIHIEDLLLRSIILNSSVSYCLSEII